MGTSDTGESGEERPELDPVREAEVYASARYATSFFRGEADIYRALERLVQRMEEANIPYAIVGAMALGEYGYRRVTVDIDILVTPDGLAAFKQRYLGRGYVEKFAGSKGLRDTETGVSIYILLTGEYPGDGKPKSVAFPDPGLVALRGERLALLPLPVLIELKLASGISAPDRLRDLADVLELIRLAGLSRETADRLDPYVRDKYLELWQAAQTKQQE